MNILEQIGNTPLLKLTRVIESPDVEIYVKCEFMNPGGSIKDRMALSMIEGAEKSGKLKSGGTIVEQSTGNTGPALACGRGVIPSPVPAGSGGSDRRKATAAGAPTRCGCLSPRLTPATPEGQGQAV